MSESKEQRKIIKLLEKNGYWVVKVISANKDGVPDLIACETRTGLFVAFEVKRPDGEGDTRAIQDYQLRKIRETGGRAYIVETVGEVKLILGL